MEKLLSYQVGGQFALRSLLRLRLERYPVVQLEVDFVCRSSRRARVHASMKQWLLLMRFDTLDPTVT